MRTRPDAVMPRKAQRQTFGGYCDAVVGTDSSRPAFAPLAPMAVANDMRKDTMSKDSMSKDSMKKEDMAKDNMSKDNMKK